MSHAFMPLYWGDYLRDTAHLNTEQHGAYLLLLGHSWQHGAIPADDGERAAITKLPLARWNKIKGPVERFFKEDGTQKRVLIELERTERKSMQARLAGAKGGQAAGISKAIRRGHMLKRTLQQTPSDNVANATAESQHPLTNHNHILKTSTEQGAEKGSTEGKKLVASPELAAIIQRGTR